MAVTSTTLPTTDSFVTALDLDGAPSSTEVRVQGSIRNTGSYAMKARLTYVSYLPETAKVVVQINPGESIDIVNPGIDLGARPPFSGVKVEVASESVGQSTNYKLSYTAW